MAAYDIFNNDAFKLVEMTQAFESVPHTPSLLRSMGIFTPMPIRTETFAIEKRDNVLSIIQTSERGAPLDERVTEKRDIRSFQTVRIAKGDTIKGSEIQFIRAFGSETEFMAVQDEISRRMAGPAGILNDVDLTEENMMLGAVQGIVLDADKTVIRNWFTEWGVTQPAEINFALTTTTTDVRIQCQAVRRAMQRAAKGAWVDGQTEVHALCGDTFYDELISHSSVKSTYQNWEAAADLREAVEFSAFYYGGIFFHNYRGTDNYDSGATKGAATVGIAPTKAKFFPAKTRGAFQMGYSPAEFFGDFNGQPGRDRYALTLLDPSGRQAWVRIEAYSYLLPVCTRPLMLQTAKDA